jgi:uncharacterized protein YjiS (DUF1127 family)
MNVELVNPTALLATVAGPEAAERRTLAGVWRRLERRIREEIRYRRALAELNRLDDRDLDDLDLGRADLPGLARRAARAG